MRPTRFFTALLAALAMLGATLSTGSSAQAAEGVVSKSGASSSTVAKAKPYHRLAVRAAEYGNSGSFYVKGRVPTYRKKPVKLQRAACETCAYKPYRSKRSGATGRFKINFDGRKGTYFRVYVPATRKHRGTFSRRVWFIT
jgi:hypothetical protein